MAAIRACKARLRMCENKGISMGKLLKFILWLVAALVLLVVIAAVVAAFFGVSVPFIGD